MASKKLSFKFGVITLRGDYFAPEEGMKKQAVLFLHGWTGGANTNAAKFLANNGYHAMTFSLPGHNDSDGDINSLSRAQSYDAILFAMDELRALLPEEMPVAVVGNSYGGYMAALISGEPSVNAISLRVPANYPDDKFDLAQMGQGHQDPNIFAWRQKLLPFSETKALRAVHEFDGKIQIIEAGLDEFVPHETVQSYVNAVQASDQLEYHFMKDWPHSLADHPARNEQFRDLLLKWLNTI